MGSGPILCGYDGSERARDGLALGRLLAETLGAEVDVLCVLTYAPAEATWAVYERMLRDEERRLVAEARRLLGARAAGVYAVPDPSPSHELHDFAETRHAQLIVLGSTHRGRLGRVMPGTVADRLLAGAPCPIAVAPSGYAKRTASLSRIAVAYDGSAEASVALAMATELAQLARASLELVVVADPHAATVAVPMAGGWAGMATTTEAVERESKRMGTVLQEALGSMPDRVDAAGEVVVDLDPTSVVTGASERSDLLLIGSRGYGPLGRVLLGSVSSRVVRDAGCPVIVTPRSIVATDAKPAATQSAVG